MPIITIAEPRFSLGLCTSTPGLMETLGEHLIDALQMALQRHARGDWGDVDDHDWQMNDNALAYGGRLLSAYAHPGTGGPVQFWVITEADRSYTTALLPSEY